MSNEEYIKLHPEQFRNETDKWLFQEFGILGGCCSAEKSHEYSIARMVAEKFEENRLKDCELLYSTTWKTADGETLPKIDREVIALVEENGHYKVVFAHRPPEYWDSRNILTNKVTRNYTKRYGKGEWNQPNVKWWLDLELPKLEG